MGRTQMFTVTANRKGEGQLAEESKQRVWCCWWKINKVIWLLFKVCDTAHS